MEEIVALNAALVLAEKLIPIVTQAVANGQVTVEAQQAARDKYNALRAKADAAFAGPEWQIE